MNGVRYDFEVAQGATFNPPIYFDDDDGAPVDLTAAAAQMTVRDGWDGSIVWNLTSALGTITLGNGVLTPLITSAQTAVVAVPSSGDMPPTVAYVYGLEVTLAGIVLPFFYGYFKVRKDPTTEPPL